MSKLIDEWGYTTAMPETVIKMMPEIGSDAVLLFLYFRYRTNKERRCAFPTYKRMSEDIGWGKTRIKKAIDTLIEHDLCKKVRRFQKSTEYYLTKPANVGVSKEEPPIIPATGIREDSPVIPAAGTLNSRSGYTKFPPTAQDLDSVNLDSVNLEEEGPKEKPSNNKHSHPPNHPSIQIFRKVMGKWPDKEDGRPMIIDAIGEDPKRIASWKQHLIGWKLSGYNRLNIAGIVDAFLAGGLRGYGEEAPAKNKTREFLDELREGKNV